CGHEAMQALAFVFEYDGNVAARPCKLGSSNDFAVLAGQLKPRLRQSLAALGNFTAKIAHFGRYEFHEGGEMVGDHTLPWPRRRLEDRCVQFAVQAERTHELEMIEEL